MFGVLPCDEQGVQLCDGGDLIVYRPFSDDLSTFGVGETVELCSLWQQTKFVCYLLPLGF